MPEDARRDEPVRKLAVGKLAARKVVLSQELGLLDVAHSVCEQTAFEISLELCDLQLDCCRCCHRLKLNPKLIEANAGVEACNGSVIPPRRSTGAVSTPKST
jgi:hypothetical protein